MRPRKWSGPAWVFVLGVLAVSAQAQQPRVVNAQTEVRSAAAGLRTSVQALVGQQVEPAWLGYAVPLVAGRRHICCYSSGNGGCCGGCRLERKSEGTIHRDNAGGVSLEGARRLLVLFRAEQRRVEKIRAFSEDCQLDAGGLRFYWLTDASAPESIALLRSFVEANGKRSSAGKLSKGALTAIALHGDPVADRALEGFVAPSQPLWLRERAAFWLGAARARPGYEWLRRLVRDDPSEQVREKAVFALSVSEVPEAVDAMIEVARNDPSRKVRGKALFWLGQKAGRKAVAAITDALEDDPDTYVKKRAVFALSQLPAAAGVPLLIRVARTNRNPAVRKKAMFWLGQSGDPRAVGFFEEILKR